MDIALGISLVDTLTLIALIAGPVIAVCITLWSQKRAEKRAAKERLFQTLMAHRRAYPTAEWASALNLIDVVYADHPNIVSDWHALYDILEQQQAGSPRWVHGYLTLLSDMAAALGYRALKQTDIDKFYLPSAQGEQTQRQIDIQQELLKLLRGEQPIYIAAHPTSQNTE